MSVFSCPECGRAFKNRHKLGFHHKKTHGERLPNRTCAQCETEFYAEYEKKYCSDTCREAGVSRKGAANPNYKGAKKVSTCAHCGEEFEYYPSSKKGVYCPSCVAQEKWRSPPVLVGEENPRWNGGKRRVACDVCGEMVERYPSNITGVVLCNEECRRTWLSDSMSGPNHPNWAGGENPAYGKGWSAVRNRALERDDHQCQICGATRDKLGRNPDVHHIVPVRWFVDSEKHALEDAHFLENVISLCCSCHRKAEFGNISRAKLRSLIGAENTDYPE